MNNKSAGFWQTANHVSHTRKLTNQAKILHLTLVLILVKPPLFAVETTPDKIKTCKRGHKQIVNLITEMTWANEFNWNKPLKIPVGPPFSPPFVSIWKLLSLTPPITTSSKAPQGRSLKLLSAKCKLEKEWRPLIITTCCIAFVKIKINKGHFKDSEHHDA